MNTIEDLLQLDVEETVYVVVKGAKKLNVRSKPHRFGDVLVTVKEGDELLLIKKGEAWSNVVTATGVEGFVSNKFIE